MRNIPGAPRDFMPGVAFNVGGGQSGTTISKTDSAPWAAQQPYLQYGYQKAGENLANPQQYFPNSTVVPFSNQTESALTGIENRAMSGSPVNAAASNNITQTLNGDFLDPTTNPAFQKASQGIQSQLGSQFGFAGVGGVGSGAHLNSARDALTDLAAKTYDAERGRQTQALGLAPSIANQDYFDMSQLGQVGAAREAKAGSELQDQINRFNFAQQEPNNALARYMAMVAGGTPGQSTATTNPIYSNPLATALGIGSSLAGIYSAFK